MRRIKFTLGWSLLLLVGVSMGVTNCVILPFWASDVATRERLALERILAAAVSAQEQAAGVLPLALQGLLAEYPGGCISWQGAWYPPLPVTATGSSCRHGLQAQLASAERGGAHPASRVSTLLDLIGSAYLYATLPEPHAGIAAAGIPLAQVLRPLWAKERAIVVYLVFNAIILTALAFFRFLRRYVLPIDRMAQSVENYQSDGLHGLIAEQHAANELGQLSLSIGAMVQRIEADKAKLTETVGELAAKNALLRDNQREMIRTEKLAAVGRLAAGLAHEIGNPLSVAQGYLQLLDMGQCSGEERDEYLGKALRELERMDRLIRRLLDYARTGQGLPARSDAQALLAGMVEDLAGQPFLKGIELAFTPQAQDCEVLVDGEQLRQVIVNCVLNAADAIDAAGRRASGKIAIAAARGTERGGAPALRITVADNGAGIPEALREAVFDPFFTTKEPGAGTGLGLSVSLTLVESMQGRMELHSKEGAGTTVTVVLPLVSGDEAAATDGDA